MASRHVLKIASRLKFLISSVIQRDLQDPRLGFITVLQVEPTEDFKEAKVRVSVLGTAGERSKALHALEDARGYIQKKVAGSLRLRHMPALRFLLEEPVDPVTRVEELLEQAKRQEAPPPSSPSSPEED